MFARGDDPDWLPLLVAVAIVAELRGIDTDTAKRVLCDAMSGRKIQVRVVELVRGKPVFTPANVPVDLAPSDLDWERSCPIDPWRMASEHSWWFQWIECFRADVESANRVWPVDMSQLLRPPTIEEQAASALAQHLEKAPNITNTEALTWLRSSKKFSQLSERSFYAKVLRDARRIAGLPEKARPGPKK
jgi:hypothetical protein